MQKRFPRYLNSNAAESLVSCSHEYYFSCLYIIFLFQLLKIFEQNNAPQIFSQNEKKKSSDHYRKEKILDSVPSTSKIDDILQIDLNKCSEVSSFPFLVSSFLFSVTRLLLLFFVCSSVRLYILGIKSKSERIDGQRFPCTTAETR
jgi:hypothetical protein